MGPRAVDDAHTVPLEVREKVLRVEERVRVAPRPGRWTHPIEHQIVLRTAARIEPVMLGVEPPVRRASDVELGEERGEPGRGFVADADHVLTPAAKEAASRGA